MIKTLKRIRAKIAKRVEMIRMIKRKGKKLVLRLKLLLRPKQVNLVLVGPVLWMLRLRQRGWR
jgi:hypothetical protein